MRQRITFVVVAIIAAFVVVPAASAQDAPAIVGTWTLNTEQSHLPPLPAGQLQVRQYSMRPDGYLVGLLFTANGLGYHYLQFTARTDGRDYPEYTDDLLADTIAAGKATTRTYAEKAIDRFVSEWTDKVNGKVTGSGRKIVSPDGQRLTITIDGRSEVLVYDRLAR